jgi:hypothetical protein
MPSLARDGNGMSRESLACGNEQAIEPLSL